jgi:hypothetical protein
MAETWLDRRVAETAREMAAAKEKYLLDYFGSREMIDRHGDDYVFEEWPVEVFDASSGWDGEAGAVSFRQKFRLRRKTQEERDAELARENVGEGTDSG